jgi:hypothetical protein
MDSVDSGQYIIALSQICDRLEILNENQGLTIQNSNRSGNELWMAEP